MKYVDAIQAMAACQYKHMVADALKESQKTLDYFYTHLPKDVEVYETTKKGFTHYVTIKGATQYFASEYEALMAVAMYLDNPAPAESETK